MCRAILNMTEGEKMKEIEDAWFKKQAGCPDASSKVSSHSLGLNSFWGLFLIAGIAAISALIISMTVFVYELGYVLKKRDRRHHFCQEFSFFLEILFQETSAHILSKPQMASKFMVWLQLKPLHTVITHQLVLQATHNTSVCRGSVYRALGLMVAASQCALALAPLVYATAISSCARTGILLMTSRARSF